jgi:putative sigma-54 modulation protein
MRIQVRIRGVDGSEELAQHTARRVHQHLSRFGRQVTGVTVRLTDVNGPRGGRDKRCQVTVTGPLIGTLHLAETHEDARSGVDMALARLGHSVGRSIQRAREAHAART